LRRKCIEFSCNTGQHEKKPRYDEEYVNLNGGKIVVGEINADVARSWTSLGPVK
jgi:hypothetical protein